MRFSYHHRWLPRCAISAFLYGVLGMPATADVADKYNLVVGASLTTFDSDVTFNSRDDSIDQEIDFEDDLGLDNELRAAWLSGMWRLTGRHRVRLTYLPIRRSSTKTLLNDIDVGDNTIRAGAFTDSSFKTDIYDIDYFYSFHKTPQWESSVSGGLYWVKTRSEIEAAGIIVSDIDGSEEVRTDFRTTQSVSAPLPLIGLHSTYELNPSVRFHAAARYLDVEVNDIDGRILTLDLRADYYFNKHVGAGLTLTSFDLNVTQHGIVFDNRLSWDYHGARIFLALRY